MGIQVKGKGGKCVVTDHLEEEESLMSCLKVSKVSDNQMG